MENICIYAYGMQDRWNKYVHMGNDHSHYANFKIICFPNLIMSIIVHIYVYNLCDSIIYVIFSIIFTYMPK